MASIFTQIINSEIPGQVVYEDDTTAALLTIEPIAPGHLLVVPKAEVDWLWDLDDATYVHINDVVRKMARHLHAVYPEYKRIASVVEGFGVPHAHVHVFGVNYGFDRTMAEHAATKRNATPEELQTEADKIRALPFAE